MGDEEDAWREFGAWLRELRESRAMQRTELANLAGLSRSNLAVLESGGRNFGDQWVFPTPTPRTLRKLAEGLGLSSEALLDAPRFPDISPAPTPLHPDQGSDAKLEQVLESILQSLKAIEAAVGVTDHPEPEEKAQ